MIDSYPRDAMMIREATRADAAEIAALGVEAFRRAHVGILEPETIEAIVAQTYSITRLEAAIARCRGALDAFFLVCHSAGTCAGYLEYDSFGNEPELHRIYVDPERKNRGVGTTLLAHLHERLPSPYAYKVLVAEANTAALAFYERRGFRPAGRIAAARYPGVDLPPDSAAIPVLILHRDGSLT